MVPSRWRDLGSRLWPPHLRRGCPLQTHESSKRKAAPEVSMLTEPLHAAAPVPQSNLSAGPESFSTVAIEGATADHVLRSVIELHRTQAASLTTRALAPATTRSSTVMLFDHKLSAIPSASARVRTEGKGDLVTSVPFKTPL